MLPAKNRCARYLIGLFLLGILQPGFSALQSIHEALLAAEMEEFHHLNREGSIDSRIQARVRILTPAGIDKVSKMEWTYSESDSLRIIAAAVIQPDGHQIPVTDAQIDTRMAPNPHLGFSRYKQTSLAFPALRVGSTIVYTQHYHQAAQPLVDSLSSQGMFFSPKPIRYDRYKIEYVSDRPIVWRSKHMDDFDIHLSLDKKKLIVQQKGIRFFHFINEPSNGYLSHVPWLLMSSSTDFQAVFGKLVKSWNQILKAPLPNSMAQAVRLVKEKAVSERVSELMQYLHENYRYLGDWRRSDRGHVPFTLSEIAERGYGDCKDLTIVLVAMLKAAGIEAEPAWVSRGPYAEAMLLPNMQLADHAIVRAKVGQQVWWLDPTNTAFMPGYVMPDIQNRWAIIFGRYDRVQLAHIPIESVSHSGIKGVFRYTLTPDGGANVRFSGVSSGFEAIHITQSDKLVGRSATDQNYCDRFGAHQGCCIQRDKAAFLTSPHYEWEGRVFERDVALMIGSQKFLLYRNASSIWQSFQQYLDHRSKSDLYLGPPNQQAYHRVFNNIKLPVLPKPCTVQSPWMDFSSKWSLEGQENVTHDFQLISKTFWLRHHELVSTEFRNFLSQVQVCTKTMEQVVTLDSEQASDSKI